jgi:hypothetical protein
MVGTTRGATPENPVNKGVLIIIQYKVVVVVVVEEEERYPRVGIFGGLLRRVGVGEVGGRESSIVWVCPPATVPHHHTDRN